VFITLKMVFVLALTTGDASNLSFQVNFVYCNMSSASATQSKFNNVIRCGTTPWSYAFMSLPFLHSASFNLCMYIVILEMEWMLKLLKLLIIFRCGPTKVGGISLDP
jgi:hypothetical protein